MRYLDKDIEEINKLLKEKIITPRILVEEAFESIEKNYNLNHKNSHISIVWNLALNLLYIVSKRTFV